ncbi:rhodanese-like domain-containing protein [Streptomyces sp. NPDC056909]|uniref:rhodanese-like domain-containing protein n=1 Tax=Streptomyces sp. NPDC056909 TaxID=3345963 RepID=UPI0036C31ABE
MTTHSRTSSQASARTHAPASALAPAPASARASASAPPAAGGSVLRVPPASPGEAAAYFGARLAFHTDVSDVAAALAADGDPGFVVLDSRSTESWDQGHVPGAVHLPTALIAGRAERLLDKAVPVVTYCWGPGCDGGTRAALALAGLGYRVKEMLGGIEYWIREGFETETAEGPERRDADPLTAPVGAADCGC